MISKVSEKFVIENSYNFLLKLIVCIFFGLLVFVNWSKADCNKCSTLSYGACVTEDKYKMCQDGKKPSDQIYECPANTVCTDTQGICQVKTATTVLGCTKPACGICSGIFACLTDKMYGMCDTSGGIIANGSCGAGNVCSIDYFKSEAASICGTSCQTTPTCDNTELITTTAAPVDINKSCTGAGNFPIQGDKTCKNYVKCESVGGKIYGVLFTCAGYFNPTTGQCQDKKPETCN